MLMTTYTYQIVQDDSGSHITLSHNTDPVKVKKFFIAGQRDVERLHSHMQSLTDELCDGFFPRPREKKGKK